MENFLKVCNVIREASKFPNADFNFLIFYYLLFFKFFLMFIHFDRDRETEHEWGRGTARETQNLKQAPGYDLSAAQSLTRVSSS